MVEKRIDEIEEEKKRHQLFHQIWESTQKQREFFEQEAEYAVVNKEKLPLPYREMKEFLGISIKNIQKVYLVMSS